MLELVDLKCMSASGLLQLLHFTQVEARGNKEVPKALGCVLLQWVFVHALHPLPVLEGLKGPLEEGGQFSRRRAMITFRSTLPTTLVYHDVARGRSA